MRAALVGVAVLAVAAAVDARAQGGAAPRAAARTEATWWGHAAWIVRTPKGTTIAIDPWLKNPKAPQGLAWPERLDAILLTHGHADHVGDAAELAKRTGALIVSSSELAQLMGTPKTAGGNVGGRVRVNDVTVVFVEAVHSSGYRLEPTGPLRYGGPALGFVLVVDGGPTLYHAGDTGVFSSMQLIAEQYRPTHAMLPIGGHYTMDAAGAAVAARLLKVKHVIPMHYGTFPLLTGTPDELRAALKKGRVPAQVLEPKPGDTLEL